MRTIELLNVKENELPRIFKREDFEYEPMVAPGDVVIFNSKLWARVAGRAFVLDKDELVIQYEQYDVDDEMIPDLINEIESAGFVEHFEDDSDAGRDDK